MTIDKKSWHYKLWRYTKTDEHAAQPVSVCQYLGDLALSPFFYLLLVVFAATLYPLEWVEGKIIAAFRVKFPSGICPHGEVLFK